MISGDLFVSVIILNFNGEEVIGKCLDSVLKTDYPNYEVIVVDNNSSDRSVELIRRFKKARILPLHRNVGYSRGNNEGAKIARGSILVFLNNDTEVEPNWLYEMIPFFNDPSIGIVGCRVVLPGEKAVQTVGMRILPSGHSETIGFGDCLANSYPELLEVDFVSGVAMAIRKCIFDELFFDPMFFAYYEDVDLCLRTRKKGYRIAVATKAIVCHEFSFSWNKLFFKKVLLNEKSRLLFVDKNFHGIRKVNALLWYTLEYDLHKILETLTGRLQSFKLIACTPDPSNKLSLHIFRDITAYIAVRLIAYPLFFLHCFQGLLFKRVNRSDETS